MREIKFRGWHYAPAVTGRVKFNGWIYGYYYKDFDRTHWIRNPDSRCYKVDPKTVEQYTNFLDKNRKEIFERDIICYENAIGELYKGKVIFMDGCFDVPGLCGIV